MQHISSKAAIILKSSIRRSVTSTGGDLRGVRAGQSEIELYTLNSSDDDGGEISSYISDCALG